MKVSVSVLAAIALSVTVAQSVNADIDYNVVACEVNKFRESQGRKPVRVSTGLSGAAKAYSSLMSRFISPGSAPIHNLLGVDFTTRLNGILSALGLSMPYENISNGAADEKAVVKDWIDSPGHRSNILSDSTDMGIGMVEKDGNKYWTQIFATDNQKHDYPVCPGNAPAPEPKPAPAPEPKPAPAPETKPAPVPETKPAPAPAPEPAYTPAPVPAPEPAYTPAPVPAPEAPAPHTKPRKCHKKQKQCTDGESKCTNGEISHCRHGRWETAPCPSNHYCKIDSPVKACCAVVPAPPTSAY
ncbi:hypothetical protein BDF22DRAFT_500948 [Syncephalis plumigaleata]|nr:hypothetical protein BDF22DRAFT_500948 [Syncephalis plumigaleata]